MMPRHATPETTETIAPTNPYGQSIARESRSHPAPSQSPKKAKMALRGHGGNSSSSVISSPVQRLHATSFVRPDTVAASAFVGAPVSLKPDDLAVAFEGQNMRGDSI